MDRFKGADDKLVVIMQDYHCNRLAQNNIINILEYFNNGDLKERLKCIAIEGAKGKVDASVLTSITDDDVRRDVIGFFRYWGSFLQVQNPGLVLIGRKLNFLELRMQNYILITCLISEIQ